LNLRAVPFDRFLILPNVILLRQAAAVPITELREADMLFCLSVNYTPKGLEAMGKNPKTNRRDAVEKLLKAAGGKLVSMYATIADGPGAMVIFDIDPAVAPAIVAVAASSDAVQNIKMQRLFTNDEMMAIRAKRVELQASYAAPGH
jgi:uncharacterized protein with GYD domain